MLLFLKLADQDDSCCYAFFLLNTPNKEHGVDGIVTVATILKFSPSIDASDPRISHQSKIRLRV